MPTCLSACWSGASLPQCRHSGRLLLLSGDSGRLSVRIRLAGMWHLSSQKMLPACLLSPDRLSGQELPQAAMYLSSRAGTLVSHFQKSLPGNALQALNSSPTPESACLAIHLKKCRPTLYMFRPSSPGPWHTLLLQLALGCLPAARPTFAAVDRQSGLARTPCRLLWRASRIQMQLQLWPLPLRCRRPQLGLSLSCRKADATVSGLRRQLQWDLMCHKVGAWQTVQGQCL